MEMSSPLEQHREQGLPQCLLRWRNKGPVDAVVPMVKQSHLPSLNSEQWSAEFLKHLLVCKPELAAVEVRSWSDECERASKLAFLRITSADTSYCVGYIELLGITEIWPWRRSQTS